MTTMTETAGSNGHQTRPNLDASLKIIPDQRAHWTTFREPLPFDDAAKMILDAARADGRREDLGIGDLSTWAFGPMPDGTACMTPIPAPGRPQPFLPLRKTAFDSLCGRIDAPAEYIKRLPGKFQIALVNHGMRSIGDKQVTARLAGGQIRGIVSERYAPLDDPFVLEVLHDVLLAAGLLDTMRVRAVATGPTTALRMTLPIEAKPVKVGDVVESGFDLLNGETGLRSLSISASTLVLSCLNGARRPENTFAFRHTGDPKRIAEAFKDAIPVVLAGADTMRKQMATAVDRIVENILAEFDGLAAFGLDSPTIKSVAKDVMAGRERALPSDRSDWAAAFEGITDMTSYEVMQGITHAAQSRGVEARLDMELAAGKYLAARTR
jgi:hypothetical protein